MNRAFLDNITDKKDFLKNGVENFNKFFLENNIKQIEDVQKFLVSKKSVMLINGFLGSGKTSLVDFSLSLLKEDVIVLKYTCFETTILDDILLLFFDEFKRLTAQGIIKPPKFKVDNFSQKIEAYFSVIEKPVLIIIDSFESVLKDNRQDILDFVFHLKNKSNIKTMFISRVFDYENFEGKVTYDRTTVLALDKSLFEKFLRSEGIKLIGPVSDELYKYSRGYFFYTMLALRVINLHKLALIDFIAGFTKSFMSYNDFILREAFGFVDPVSGHLFRFLSVVRHPVSITLLKTLQLYNEQSVQFFLDNLILSRDKDMIYFKDYYKEIARNSIPESVSVKLHKACVDLYNTQLPLKPFERDLLISRQTMRSEIEFHTSFIPKRHKINFANGLNEEGRIQENGLNPGDNLSKTSAEEISSQEKMPHNLDEDSHSIVEKLENISFIFETEDEEKKIMGGIAESINKFIDYSNKTLTEEETKQTLQEMLNSAKAEETKYNYKKAVAYYLRALLMKNDDDFYTFLPHIYTKLAHCYSVLSDWFNSMRYYELALEFYNSAGDVEKSAAMKLEIANIFFITFKHDRAKDLLDEIVAQRGVSSLVLIKAYLALNNLSTDDLNACYSYCKKAVELVEPLTDKEVLAELYFKYAVVCDDMGDTETSVQFYKKCIEIDKHNSYMSSAYSNLASMFEDANYTDYALKYYTKSFEIDLRDKNYNGMYLVSLKLAQLYTKTSSRSAEEYYNEAIRAAKALKEPFYELSALIQYGDFCVAKKDLKQALREYMEALELAKLNSSADNIPKIQKRIDELRIRLGDDYAEITKEIINER